MNNTQSHAGTILPGLVEFPIRKTRNSRAGSSVTFLDELSYKIIEKLIPNDPNGRMGRINAFYKETRKG